MGRTTGVEVGIGLASPTADVGVASVDEPLMTATVGAGVADSLPVPVPQAAKTTVVATSMENKVVSNSFGDPTVILNISSFYYGGSLLLTPVQRTVTTRAVLQRA